MSDMERDHLPKRWCSYEGWCRPTVQQDQLINLNSIITVVSSLSIEYNDTARNYAVASTMVFKVHWINCSWNWTCEISDSSISIIRVEQVGSWDYVWNDLLRVSSLPVGWQQWRREYWRWWNKLPVAQWWCLKWRRWGSARRRPDLSQRLSWPQSPVSVWTIQ